MVTPQPSKSTTITLCGGCAFRAGTEAHTHKPTQVLVALCRLAGTPFYCHERFTANGVPLRCEGFLRTSCAGAETTSHDDVSRIHADRLLAIVLDLSSSRPNGD